MLQKTNEALIINGTAEVRTSVQLHVPIKEVWAGWIIIITSLIDFCLFKIDRKRHTVESRFLKPVVFRKSQSITRIKSRFPFLEKHYIFTLDFSSFPIFRTKFRFPWRFENPRYLCIRWLSSKILRISSLKATNKLIVKAGETWNELL